LFKEQLPEAPSSLSKEQLPEAPSSLSKEQLPSLPSSPEIIEERMVS